MKKATYFYLLRRGFFSGGGSASSFTGLLDTYSGAAAAYSLRKLSSTYSGDAIVVRRSSDNTTQAIGFVNNELDTATLESFCSGTDGFVTTWYDQSGSGNGVAQATASNQPQIVVGGSTILLNGKPACDFVSNTKSIATTNSVVSGGENRSVIFVGEMNTNLDYPIGLGVEGTSQRFSLKNDAGEFRVEVQGAGETTTLTTSTQDVILVSTSGTNLNTTKVQVNNQSEYGLTTSFTINTASGLRLGSRSYNYSNALSGYIQECIIYTSDENSNFSGIKTNINDHYSIY